MRISIDPAHAERVIVNAIKADAKAAGVEARQVTGEIAAGIDVCGAKCQPMLKAELPNVKILNPQPK
jgi:hypothetical protein